MLLCTTLPVLLFVAVLRNTNVIARSQVLTAVLLKIQVICDVTTCQLVNSYRRFEDASFLRNVSHYVVVDTAYYPRRLESS
jgi:hypothetical protein